MAKNKKLILVFVAILAVITIGAISYMITANRIESRTRYQSEYSVTDFTTLIQECRVENIGIDSVSHNGELDMSTEQEPTTPLVLTTLKLKSGTPIKGRTEPASDSPEDSYVSIEGDYSTLLIKEAESYKDRCGNVSFERRG